MMDLNKTAFDFSFQSATGAVFPLSHFRGKVLLIVNTASQCGFTRQYQALEQLYKQYQDRGLVVIGVPSNDFGGQEPGTDEEIQAFCQTRFGVTFPVVKKEPLKGASIHPFYRWARETFGFGTAPKWNFHKY
nr:glutathione peroxidase [Gammaproteobacteria bacterium]